MSGRAEATAGILLFVSIALLTCNAAMGADPILADNFEPALTPAAAGSPQPLNPRLLDLPVNRWVQLHQPEDAKWRRRPHAGLAYDSKRGQLLMFGSETHGTDWGNEVRSFNPFDERWELHYSSAAPETYRTDDRGRPVAGEESLQPWAMHAFDSVIYDPSTDTMVITSSPEHNTKLDEFGAELAINITWIYDLADRQWRILDNDGQPAPSTFAAATAYDGDRDALVAYVPGGRLQPTGIWELGPERRRWQQSTAEQRHQIHHMMVYDSRQRVLLVFGDYKGSSEIWAYRPAALGQAGSWEQRLPTGVNIPSDEHYPVAYDPDAGLVLLVVDDADADSSDTFVYDYDSDSLRKLPAAGFPFLQGYNYMMAYDIYHRVFLLVTGSWRAPAIVWALKLDRDILD